MPNLNKLGTETSLNQEANKVRINTNDWPLMYSHFTDFTCIMSHNTATAMQEGKIPPTAIGVARKMQCAAMEGNFEEVAVMAFLLYQAHAPSDIVKQATLHPFGESVPHQEELFHTGVQDLNK